MSFAEVREALYIRIMEINMALIVYEQYIHKIRPLKIYVDSICQKLWKDIDLICLLI